MKKNIFLLSILALTVLAGCGKDFLNEAPKLSQSDELTLSTFDGLNKSAAGCYSPLASSNWYGRDFILVNELKTMNGKKLIGTEYDSGRCKEHYNVNWLPSNTTALWGTAYYVIVSASEVIDHLENAEGEAGVSAQDLNNIKAECLFLRALAHFDLVRTYAQPYCYSSGASHLGVPVVLHKDPSAFPERNTVKEVYDAIIADLTEAESIISPSYLRAGVDDKAAAVDIYAIQALLARAYLYSEQWQKAADYATKVINSGKFSLWKASDFATPEDSPYCADTHDGDEVIFEVYGKKTNDYDGYWDGLANMCAPASYGDAGATEQLIGIYEASDARKNLFVDDTYGDKKAPGVHWSSKYLGKGAGTPDVTNTIVLRLSEMYLIRAEAVGIHNASGANATEDMKKIAERVGATPQAATQSGIAMERAKELAWEGHLWFDLGRTKSDMNRVDETGTGVIESIPWGSKYFAMPIPESQIKVDPNLVQNEGY